MAAPKFDTSEIANPRKTLARRMAAAEGGDKEEPVSGPMTQSEFSRASQRGVATPPAELMKRHRAAD